jgi:uncharacterized short protein YbdD (DUF466 family)
MSIIESYKNKIVELKQYEEYLNNIKINHPEKKYLEMLLNSELMEYQRRLESLSSGKLSYRCSFCTGYIKEEGYPTMVHNLTICNSCKATISEVMTTNQAEEEWNLPKGTIKQDCKPHGGLQQFILAGLVFKSGKYWLIHKTVMKEYYEPLIENRKRN